MKNHLHIYVTSIPNSDKNSGILGGRSEWPNFFIFIHSNIRLVPRQFNYVHNSLNL